MVPALHFDIELYRGESDLNSPSIPLCKQRSVRRTVLFTEPDNPFAKAMSRSFVPTTARANTIKTTVDTTSTGNSSSGPYHIDAIRSWAIASPLPDSDAYRAGILEALRERRKHSQDQTDAKHHHMVAESTSKDAKNVVKSDASAEPTSSSDRRSYKITRRSDICVDCAPSKKCQEEVLPKRRSGYKLASSSDRQTRIRYPTIVAPGGGAVPIHEDSTSSKTTVQQFLDTGMSIIFGSESHPPPEQGTAKLGVASIPGPSEAPATHPIRLPPQSPPVSTSYASRSKAISTAQAVYTKQTASPRVRTAAVDATRVITVPALAALGTDDNALKRHDALKSARDHLHRMDAQRRHTARTRPLVRRRSKGTKHEMCISARTVGGSVSNRGDIRAPNLGDTKMKQRQIQATHRLLVGHYRLMADRITMLKKEHSLNIQPNRRYGNGKQGSFSQIAATALRSRQDAAKAYSKRSEWLPSLLRMTLPALPRRPTHVRKFSKHSEAALHVSEPQQPGDAGVSNSPYSQAAPLHDAHLIGSVIPGKRDQSGGDSQHRSRHIRMFAEVATDGFEGHTARMFHTD